MTETGKKKSDLAVLLEYSVERRGLTFLGLALSAVAMLLSMVPYICIWLVVRDLIAVAPNWSAAANVGTYGWMAFWFAVAGILVYFFGLMGTHLAAFRTASNIRKRGMAHLMNTPLGYFDNNASGLIRNRLDGASAETETLLAHNLADIVGTVAMFVGMLVLMFVFDWRMGAACLLAAVISIVSMFAMMGGKNAGLMQEYQAAQDRMSKAGTEYVRGIPVVKVFQQTVNSFKAFKEAIEDYSEKAGYYQGDVCRVPQSVNLTFTEGAFVFLVPVALFLAPGALASGDFAGFVTNFAFYAVFSAIISTALARIMFAASGMMLASTALGRIQQVMDAPVLRVTNSPVAPQGNRVEFKDVSFTYEGAAEPALKNVSFVVEPGQTVALVGPSGGGKTTAASLIPRFWDTTEGTVEVGGVDVRDMDPHVLMDQVAFVFQNNRLFKTSILENVRAARPEASREEVEAALAAAQCDDIIAKLPEGIDTKIGTEGTYLSGGEQQRIALARAILKGAPIVVLDEATAFADPENEGLLQKAFATLTQG
ncbi:MAG: ABC transporter ATP-binding protein, partial [Eggerthellaceae bacterium]|nr:ABC transporter ATP-binding protein [Eggerthellaceae bacterium]